MSEICVPAPLTMLVGSIVSPASTVNCSSWRVQLGTEVHANDAGTKLNAWTSVAFLQGSGFDMREFTIFKPGG